MIAPLYTGDVDCDGGWMSCTAECQMTYMVFEAQSGNGAACEAAEGQIIPCFAGEGDCPEDIACVGAWSSCTASCQKSYTVYSQKSGNGADCEAADGALSRDCAAGEGDCPGLARSHTRAPLARTQLAAHQPTCSPRKPAASHLSGRHRRTEHVGGASDDHC